MSMDVGAWLVSSVRAIRRNGVGNDSCARVHHARRCDRSAQLDFRVRIRPENGPGDRPPHGRMRGHPARTDDVRDVRAGLVDENGGRRPGRTVHERNPKYVVSATLKKANWSNSKIVGPYDAGAIRGIVDGVKGGIYVSGSGKLVRALLADDLVDELHLFVFPLTIGPAGHLFSEDAPATKWALTTSETYANGVVYLVYRRAGSRA